MAVNGIDRIKLCHQSDVAPGTMSPVQLEGLPALAVFNLDGKIYVTSNTCTHNVATLTDGYLENDLVECPLHGGTFNIRTGDAVGFPCVVPLRTYQVVVENGTVFIVKP